ncbi:cyclic-phosphate processing receiver domain-containing protein [Domibacillus antri]|uniref:cyclic-phosphate processing receiver domain-containing protein n=1 Tax=Domibacillus antri TaxID=1714264 RepID=UPI00318411BC
MRRTHNETRKNNLYVDDLRDCPTGFKIARNVGDALYYFNKYHIHILSLDYDLGGK